MELGGGAIVEMWLLSVLGFNIYSTLEFTVTNECALL